MKAPKKTSIASRRKPRKKKSRLLYILTFLAASVLVSGTFLIAKYDGHAERSVDSPATRGTLLQARKEAIQQLESLTAKLNNEALNLEDLDLLENTINLFRKQVDRTPAEMEASDRALLQELQGVYEREMGTFLSAQSYRLESEAMELSASGQVSEATAALKKAHSLQVRINDQFPDSPTRNHGRAHSLGNRLLHWETEPIAAEADRLRSEAFAQRQQRSYAAARSLMDQALDQQKLLYENYRASPYATLARLKDFHQASTQIRAAEDLDTLFHLLNEARERVDAGESSAAMVAIQRAREVQAAIAGNYPDLKDPSASYQSELDALRDTAASMKDFATLKQLGTHCRTLLRERKPDEFVNAVSAWMRNADSFLEQYPESKLIEQISLAELRYLHDHRHSVASLLDTVFANLNPLPGEEGLYMYRTEVPQFLFQNVMDHNPSSHRDPLLPADSITWSEAEEFTTLLGWILARPVSLPTLQQFRNAVGEVPPADKGNGIWSSENSGRATHPVGTSIPDSNGFYDLLGNVAEWLVPSASGSASKAPLAGGSVRDTLENLGDIPVEEEHIAERNRFSGFRFVVDLESSVADEPR